jgi:hypothetical protein
MVSELSALVVSTERRSGETSFAALKINRDRRFLHFASLRSAAVETTRNFVLAEAWVFLP